MQISRQLNPTDFEDRDYLIGLPASQQLGPDEDWFGVFVRVENDSEGRAGDLGYSIRDTQGNVYRPVAIGPNNLFAYRAAVLRPTDVLPVPSTPAAENTIQGALLLFKVTVANFQNRPLELQIRRPGRRDGHRRPGRVGGGPSMG